ncbi:MAG: ABC transporter substrate-binding protein [Thaumarchaeota archaeon]|nr:ABC transporter substrate-binding protein [Candidatus Calditenuaceae archaeon]MDW8186839.1 ABC transporter substrate-binding protein [Nitrososphaerota archaeon]
MIKSNDRKFWVASTLMSAMLIMTAVMVLSPVYAQTAPKGPWIDEVSFFIERDEAKVVDMLLNNEIQVYFRELRDPANFRRVKESPALQYAMSYGLAYELTFNPVGPEFPATGKLNPFSVPRIREAMNYLVDRSYVANEITGGLAIPRYTVLTPAFPDYARYADFIRQIETVYAYNFEKARQIITEEMRKLGAELIDGKWHYKGEPVTLIFIIRVEDQRRQIGDYISSQLERIGFTVDRQYKTSREAAPIWIRGNPADGQWHLYTGGWITEAITIDEGDSFGVYYTPRGLPVPLWQAYKPDPEFDRIAGRLWNREFSTIEERHELMTKALTLSMKDSVRVWLVQQIAAWPARKEVSVTADLAGGYSGSRLWPHTIRYVDRVGGAMRIASTDLLVDPVNPVAGSNWIYDMFYVRATSDPALLPDPFTGLYWPQRIKSADVFVTFGNPVGARLDWVTLRFVPEITVPRDAWYGWDAERQEIVYTPPDTTAKVKTVVYFEDDLFKRKFHDGSTMSIADIIYSFILTFDRADRNSPIFDESYVPVFQEFRQVFKGLRILSEDPLVIEVYTDKIYLDAEWIAAEAASLFFTDYPQGPGPWHVVAVSALAEAAGELAFSVDKANELKVEWMNLLAGPSLAVLKKHLDRAIETAYIPYENILGRYISKEEAVTRYRNLEAWYDSKGHFLVGNGPFYLDKVDITAKIVVLKAFREFPDTADKWAGFATPRVPEAKFVQVPIVEQGFPAELRLSVTFKDTPYRTDDIEYIKYIIISPAGTSVGYAEPIADGSWRIVLKPEETYTMPTGSATIEAIVVSKLVGMPVSVSTPVTVLSFKETILGELARARADADTKIAGLRSSLDAVNQQLKDVSTSMQNVQTTLTLITALAVLASVLALASIGLSLVRGRRAS